ncbi:GNAT family N-acetyltransferase [Terrabacter lapilli]
MWQLEVRSLLRDLELWRETVDRHVLVFREPDSEDIAAVLAYRDLLPGYSNSGFFVYALAVDARFRRKGYGTTVLAAALESFSCKCPGCRVTWLVHQDNEPCIALSERFGVAAEPSSEHPDYLVLSTTV